MSLASAFYDVPGNREATVAHIAHAAATATESLAAWKSPCRALLKGVSWVPLASVTGTNTDSTNINIVNRGTDGGSSTELANKDFAAGTNATGFDELAIYAPSAGSELQMSQGSVISCTFEKVGNGLALPAGTFIFTFEPN